MTNDGTMQLHTHLQKSVTHEIAPFLLFKLGVTFCFPFIEMQPFSYKLVTKGEVYEQEHTTTICLM